MTGEDHRVSQSGADPGAGPGGDGLGHQGPETAPRPASLLTGETSSVSLLLGSIDYCTVKWHILICSFFKPLLYSSSYIDLKVDFIVGTFLHRSDLVYAKVLLHII